MPALGFGSWSFRRLEYRESRVPCELLSRLLLEFLRLEIEQEELDALGMGSVACRLY